MINEDISVDIWFCYGSFSYGFESSIVTASENSVSLAISAINEEECAEKESFFDTLIDKPKGLLRIDIKIYPSANIIKKINVQESIFLYTDILPKLSHKQSYSPVLLFSSLKGVSPDNQEYWLRFVRQIWHSQD